MSNYNFNIDKLSNDEIQLNKSQVSSLTQEEQIILHSIIDKTFNELPIVQKRIFYNNVNKFLSLLGDITLEQYYVLSYLCRQQMLDNVFKVDLRLGEVYQKYEQLFKNSAIEKYKPVDQHELKVIISRSPEDADLNYLDVSEITDMSYLFSGKKFNGDISQWDVSHVTKMSHMFSHSQFNGDISRWNVSNVTNMAEMFRGSTFNNDISQWDVSNVTCMDGMFSETKFNGDISRWNVSNVKIMSNMFAHSQFNGDISNWDISSVTYMNSMFSYNKKFKQDLSKWDVSKVISLTQMFYFSNYNQDISNWKLNCKRNGIMQMFRSCRCPDRYKPFIFDKETNEYISVAECVEAGQ